MPASSRANPRTAVLLIDADATSRRFVRAELEATGHRVEELADARDSLRFAAQELPDAIVLASDGDDSAADALCLRFKHDTRTASLPVLLVVHASDEQARIAAFEAGADDVVVRPFSVRELCLRVRVLVERRRSPTAGCALLRLDVAAHRVFVAGTEIFLSRTEFALLATLCERPHRIRSRAALLADVWGHDLQATPRFVDAYVSRLKQKLGPAGWCIRAVRGVGYRMDSLGQF